jgi:type II secretory pathway pseudopilin PulG
LSGRTGKKQRRTGIPSGPRNAGGYTLVEMLVVAAIIVTVMAMVVFFMMSAKRSGQRDECQEEYWRQLALLQAVLKKDLRNAVVLEGEEGNYSIKTASMDTDGRLKLREVTYVVKDSEGTVERIDETGAKRYEFKEYLEDRQFVFKLEQH